MFGLGPIGRWFQRPEEPAKEASAGLNLAAEDIAELAAVGKQVAAEYGMSSPAVLSANLQRLIRRQVPIRALRAAEVSSVCGLHFADGTVVLVRGRHSGDLGRVAVGIQFGPVRVDDFHTEAGQVTLDVSYSGRHDQLCVLGVTGPR
ncbi:MAG: hypothetical protein LCH87_06715 [Actinobacteria bacterium]|nr:hypothetical protein [Actinomycetota bacterium]MCA0307048.1 hypothetical protein [Actinomycetota bacterium]